MCNRKSTKLQYKNGKVTNKTISPIQFSLHKAAGDLDMFQMRFPVAQEAAKSFHQTNCRLEAFAQKRPSRALASGVKVQKEWGNNQRLERTEGNCQRDWKTSVSQL